MFSCDDFVLVLIFQLDSHKGHLLQNFEPGILESSAVALPMTIIMPAVQ